MTDIKRHLKVSSVFFIRSQEPNFWSLDKNISLLDKDKWSLVCSPVESTTLNENSSGVVNCDNFSYFQAEQKYLEI
jgi:hypothetical protein